MKKSTLKKELTALIQAELEDIAHLVKELKKCTGDNQIIRRAKGSILHDFYNACERIFELIAREINGGLPASGQWHKKLLYRMTLPIKGVRPAVISKEAAAKLDEFLAFRHLFRNIYGFELESGKIDELTAQFPQAAKLFQKEIATFIKKL
jgi:hypothetical protein